MLLKMLMHKGVYLSTVCVCYIFKHKLPMCILMHYTKKILYLHNVGNGAALMVAIIMYPR